MNEGADGQSVSARVAAMREAAAIAVEELRRERPWMAETWKAEFEQRIAEFVASESDTNTFPRAD